MRIASNVPCIPILNSAGSVREAVPNRFAFAIRVPTALDLVSRGGCAPEEVLGERDLRRRIKLSRGRAWQRRGSCRTRCIRDSTRGKQSGWHSGGEARAESGVGKLAASHRQSRLQLLGRMREQTLILNAGARSTILNRNPGNDARRI
jgi:hypothetical protein